MTINNLLRSAMGLLTAAFLGLILYNLHDSSAKEGGKAPQFQVRTDQGRTVTPEAFGGKVLVLNFWASWCQPCVQEIPSLNQFQRRFQQAGVVVVAISVDKNASKYKTFLSRIPVAFETVRDGNADVSDRFGTYQYPETYVIKDGRVVRKFPQAEDWTSDDITQYVQSLL